MDTTTNMRTKGTNSATTTYTPAEGDVTYQNKKIQIWHNGKWDDANEDVRLDNDVVVHQSGKVSQGEKEVVQNDDEIVN